MGNLIDLPGINVDALTIENNSPERRASTFNSQNYLNVRLEKGEKKKTVTIRLLPMNLETGNPFVLVHMHNVKVPKEVSQSGWKSYLCLNKNKDIDHEKYGNRCPFCEINHSAYEESTKATDPVERKKWQDISIEHITRKAVIVRCIERGKEDEGVKFWKFNLRQDEKDPYHSIMNLYNMRKAESGENIFDYEKGRDLNVIITEGNNAPTIFDGRQCSLSNDYEQAAGWINDSKKWQDVFATKSYEYLSLVSQMKVPYYDKEKGLWVDYEEWKETHNSQKQKADEEIKQAEASLKGSPDPDDSFMNAISLDEGGTSPADIDDDNLPF